MAAKEKQQKKKKGRSTQELVGIKTFTKYGLETNKNELLFYLVAPTNISVLSHMSVEIKIRHLLMVLSALPNIEITCTDSCECFDDNKSYLQQRLSEEQNPKVRKILKKDVDMLDHVQAEMATARQYYADLSPVVGSEQGGIRPVLILQNDKTNQNSTTTIVAAMTSQIKNNLQTHVKVSGHGLKKESLVLLEQIRTIDKVRLMQYIGRLGDKDMKKIDRALTESLSIKNSEVLSSG